MTSRSRPARPRATGTPPREHVSPLAAVVFDLDEHDVLAIGDDLDEIETLDDTWVEADDDTVMTSTAGPAEPDLAAPHGYAPGLSDDEVDAIVGGLTRELCRAAPRQSTDRDRRRRGA
jgi:hypothetical protein